MNTSKQTKTTSIIPFPSLPLVLASMLAATLLPAPGTASDSAASGNSTNRFSITGMTCDGCARGIASELRRVAGVVSAEVTFSNKLAVVVCDTRRASTEALRKAISEAGYESKLIKPAKSGPR